MTKTQALERRIEELERRVRELEARPPVLQPLAVPVFQPVPVSAPSSPNFPLWPPPVVTCAVGGMPTERHWREDVADALRNSRSYNTGNVVPQ